MPRTQKMDITYTRSFRGFSMCEKGRRREGERKGGKGGEGRKRKERGEEGRRKGMKFRL